MTGPPWRFMILGTAIALYAVTMGALLRLSPQRFVSLYRRAILGDNAPDTIEWQKAVEGLQGRVFGALVFAFGCCILWIIYFH